MPELGKYADTVLSAYGVSIAMLVLLVWISVRQGRKTRQALREVEDRREGRHG